MGLGQIFKQKASVNTSNEIPGRHQFFGDIEVMEAEYRKNPDITYTFVYFDINNLKEVKEEFGQEEADAYVRSIAAILQKNLVLVQQIYRLGGDEFLAVYHGISWETIQKELGRAEDELEDNKHKKYLTDIASGYASSGPEYNSLQEVLHTANYAMYCNRAEIGSHHTLIRNTSGEQLNVDGLTDRLFEAMCTSNERTYPFMMNLETNVARISPKWKQAFGFRDEFYYNFADVWVPYIHPDDQAAFVEDITDTLSGKKAAHNINYRARTKDGKYVFCSCRGALYPGTDGDPTIFAGFLTNHEVGEQYDSGTGLPNFMRLNEYVSEIISLHRRAVILKLRIYNYDNLNMLYGYESCEVLRKLFAENIQEIVRKNNGQVFCHFVWDFSILFYEGSKLQTRILYDRIKQMCENGIEVEGAIVPLQISGGGFEIAPDIKVDPPAIRSALLYALNESGGGARGKLVFFDEAMKLKQRSDFQILADIHYDSMAERQYFRMKYQPIVDLNTGEIRSAEALIRWIHPAYGEVSPGRFIGFLENDPCYYELGKWILKTALTEAARIRQYIPKLRININITAIQLQRADFIPTILETLRETGTEPYRLYLELTERCKELDNDFLKEKLGELRKAGIRIALDDMGTGYSTIDLLMNIPVDEVKLDRQFVIDIPQNRSYQTFTEALTKGMNDNRYVLCFEGIEDPELADYLKQYGNVLAQGYLYGKPMLAEEWIRKYETK